MRTRLCWRVNEHEHGPAIHFQFLDRCPTIPSSFAGWDYYRAEVITLPWQRYWMLVVVPAARVETSRCFAPESHTKKTQSVEEGVTTRSRRER